MSRVTRFLPNIGSKDHWDGIKCHCHVQNCICSKLCHTFHRYSLCLYLKTRFINHFILLLMIFSFYIIDLFMLVSVFVFSLTIIEHSIGIYFCFLHHYSSDLAYNTAFFCLTLHFLFPPLLSSYSSIISLSFSSFSEFPCIIYPLFVLFPIFSLLLFIIPFSPPYLLYLIALSFSSTSVSSLLCFFLVPLLCFVSLELHYAFIFSYSSVYISFVL